MTGARQVPGERQAAKAPMSSAPGGSLVWGSPDFRPIPDPTLLTTQQITEKILSLKELVFTRLDAMDKALIVFNDHVAQSPTDTDRQLSHLRTFHDEKFDNLREQIRIQFIEIGNRVTVMSQDSKTALAAALQASKEIATEQNKSSSATAEKNEANITKQLDQITALFTATSRAIDARFNDLAKTYDGKFSDLKDRLSLIEGRSLGQGTLVAQVVGAIGTFALVLGAIYAFTHK